MCQCRGITFEPKGRGVNTRVRDVRITEIKRSPEWLLKRNGQPRCDKVHEHTASVTSFLYDPADTAS